MVFAFSQGLSVLNRFLEITPYGQENVLSVAVSGGSDSLAAALLLHTWCLHHKKDCVAWIVDHGLRPESEQEARWTQSVVEGWGRKAKILRWDRASFLGQGTLMQRARQARYRLMVEACLEAGVRCVLLGHHVSDQEETYRMRLDEETGWRGMAGMPSCVIRHGVAFMRPFLAFSKEALRASLQETGYTWLEDPSNHNPRFARSRLRQQETRPAEREELSPNLSLIWRSKTMPASPRSDASRIQAIQTREEWQDQIFSFSSLFSEQILIRPSFFAGGEDIDPLQQSLLQTHEPINQQVRLSFKKAFFCVPQDKIVWPFTKAAEPLMLLAWFRHTFHQQEDLADLAFKPFCHRQNQHIWTGYLRSLQKQKTVTHLDIKKLLMFFAWPISTFNHKEDLVCEKMAQKQNQNIGTLGLQCTLLFRDLLQKQRSVTDLDFCHILFCFSDLLTFHRFLGAKMDQAIDCDGPWIEALRLMDIQNTLGSDPSFWSHHTSERQAALDSKLCSPEPIPSLISFAPDVSMPVDKQSIPIPQTVQSVVIDAWPWMPFARQRVQHESQWIQKLKENSTVFMQGAGCVAWSFLKASDPEDQKWLMQQWAQIFSGKEKHVSQESTDIVMRALNIEHRWVTLGGCLLRRRGEWVWWTREWTAMPSVPQSIPQGQALWDNRFYITSLKSNRLIIPLGFLPQKKLFLDKKDTIWRNIYCGLPCILYDQQPHLIDPSKHPGFIRFLPLFDPYGVFSFISYQ